MALYEELEMDQGSTFRYQVDLKTSSGNPYNLEGVTITSQIRKTYRSASIAGTFTTGVTDPAAGVFTLSMTDEQTSAIAAGRYVFDVYIEDIGGTRYRVLEGMVTVTPGVTQV